MRQAHRSTTLSLLCFHPGEVRQELVAWRGAKVERHSEYANVVEKFLEVFESVLVYGFWFLGGRNMKHHKPNTLKTVIFKKTSLAPASQVFEKQLFKFVIKKYLFSTRC